MTAPPEEIRNRPRKLVNQNDVQLKLRLKQDLLVEAQLKLQQVLLQNAVIAQEEDKGRVEFAKQEAEERLKILVAQRKCA